MAENQLPVLTLDFSDEKIKKLEEIAEKFRAGFAVGPGGFPVAEQKAIPGNNSQPQRMKETESTFDKFMKSLDKEGKATLKTFTLIDKTLQQTTSTLKGLFSTTISWGVKIAGLAAGSSFFGYDMLAKHAADQLKLYQGLHMSPGQMRAADSVYGKRFSSVDEVEQVLAAAQSDPTSKEYAAISSLGLKPELGASQNLPLFYQKMDEVQKRYGANALAMLKGSGLGWFGTSYLNEVKANSDILPMLPQQYSERSKTLDSELGPGTLQSFQNLSSTFDNNGDQIVFTFLNALKTLNPAITSLSNTLTADIDKFINGNGKRLFTDVATGLTELGHWLDSQQFQQDLTDFEKAIKDIAHAVGSAAKWILGLVSGDLDSITSGTGKDSADSPLVMFGNKYLFGELPGANPISNKYDAIWTEEDAYKNYQMPDALKKNIQNFVNLANYTYQLPKGMMSAIAGKESSWNPLAKNQKSGAAGLFQFIPETAKRYGLSENERYDPDKETYAAGRYLHDLMTKYHGNIAEVLTAYDGGKVEKNGNLSLKMETINYLISLLPQIQGALEQNPGIMGELSAARDQISGKGKDARATVELQITPAAGSDYAAQVKSINQYPG
ncbi:transglycosylase SLT domain-containing protein [Salmonella enterica subsp. enterica]|nr:transglycosylase SLT domain-containing protein [Salmonella enterica subsp. enterica]EHW9181797.1 transglycosylase SLT domain-containing protein [Salmonella enterica subsp. enterica]